MTGGEADRAESVDLLASYWTLAGPVELHTGREWSLFDVADRVTAAANAGFRGLGLWHDDLLHILQERGLAELRTILDDAGMVHLELEFLSDWFLDPGTQERRHSDQLRRTLLEAAGVLGARHVKVGNFAGRQVPLGLLTERFAELCAEAAEHGTCVAYEFMYRDTTAGSLEAARSVVLGAGAANGGLALDLWHVVDLGVSTAEIRALPTGCVVAAEVSDGPLPRVPGARRSLRDRRLPGDGDFDIAGFVAAVRATGFRGPWGVEVLSAVIGDLTLPDDSAARASLELAELARRAYRSTIEHVARDRYERSGREAGDDKEA
ncbi:MAG TPA: sugar phosphate isomerase/epimerase [Micromonosporaceae bacterium]|jgi:sugar phosphate isomerase/epimerase